MSNKDKNSSRGQGNAPAATSRKSVAKKVASKPSGGSDKMSQELTREQEQLVQEIKKRVEQIRAYKPKVGVFGNSGVGKSSLCNALFGKDVAKINDVEACTREPQEILLGSENGGITLLDVPGIGEDPSRQKEYTALYKSLAPKLDLVLWAIKSDDRSYASALDTYKEVFSSFKEPPPVLFVITQTDKTNDVEDWDHNEYKPGGTQIGNIAIKERDVSRRFEITAKQIISVAVSKKGRSYNLQELVDLVVDALPREKRYSITREAKAEYVSTIARESAEKGIWESIKEFAGDALSAVGGAVGGHVIKILADSAPAAVKTVYKAGKAVWKWVKGLW